MQDGIREIGSYSFTEAHRTGDCYRGQLQTVYGCRLILRTIYRAFFTDTECSCFFCVFGFELYADLPIVLTIVHCDGTYILSLHTSQQRREPQECRLHQPRQCTCEEDLHPNTRRLSFLTRSSHNVCFPIAFGAQGTREAAR
jgi:hypothetical protein